MLSTTQETKNGIHVTNLISTFAKLEEEMDSKSQCILASVKALLPWSLNLITSTKFLPCLAMFTILLCLCDMHAAL